MPITKRPFGMTRDGQSVTCYTMTNENGMTVEILSYAAAIRAVVVPDRNGGPVDVALGCDTVLEYEWDPCYFGKLVGRYANRLRNARFAIDGVTWQLWPNEGANHLHGSFSFRNYEGEASGNTLTFRILSRDGEEGYPGNLTLCLTYTLKEDNTLLIDYRAETDRATVLNLTNHSYFNLSGHGSGTMLDQQLWMNASHYTASDEHSLLTGEICPVEGTPFDFRRPKAIGRDIDCDHPMLRFGSGYDLNMVLDAPSMETPSATAWSGETGIAMDYFTTMPGTQLYSGNFIAPKQGRPCKEGELYVNRQGFCLESQFFPCSPDFDRFPTTILRPGQEYHHQTAYRFYVK